MLPLAFVLIWALVAGNLAGIFIGPAFSRVLKTLSANTAKHLIPTSSTSLGPAPSAKVNAPSASGHRAELFKGLARYGGAYLPAHLGPDSTSMVSGFNLGPGTTLSDVDPTVVLFLAAVGIVFGIVALVKKWALQPPATPVESSRGQESALLHLPPENAVPSYDTFLADLLSIDRAPGVSPSVMGTSEISTAFVDNGIDFSSSFYGLLPPLTPTKVAWESTPTTTPHRRHNNDKHHVKELKLTGRSMTLDHLGSATNPQMTGDHIVGCVSRPLDALFEAPLSPNPANGPCPWYDGLVSSPRASVSPGIAATRPAIPTHTPTKVKTPLAPILNANASPVNPASNRASTSLGAQRLKLTTPPPSTTLHGVTATLPPSTQPTTNSHNGARSTTYSRRVRHDAEPVRPLGGSLDPSCPISRPQIPTTRNAPVKPLRGGHGAMKPAGGATRPSRSTKAGSSGGKENSATARFANIKYRDILERESKFGPGGRRWPPSSDIVGKVHGERAASRDTAVFGKGDGSKDSFSTQAKLDLRRHSHLSSGARTVLRGASPTPSSGTALGRYIDRLKDAQPRHSTSTRSEPATGRPRPARAPRPPKEAPPPPQFPIPFEHVVPEVPVTPPGGPSKPRAYLAYMRASDARTFAALRAGSYKHQSIPPSPAHAEPPTTPTGRRLELLEIVPSRYYGS